jgi:polyketide cyclase/dehydrase/lipid transport protein
MRTVHVSASAYLPRDVAWRLLTDIPAYPGRVRFVKRVRLHDPIAVGARWDDLTGILWAPFWVRHTITRLDPPHAFAFDVHMPAGATMSQEFSLAPEGACTLLRATVRFHLPHGAIDAIVGPLLERRLTAMLTSSCAAVQEPPREWLITMTEAAP